MTFLVTGANGKSLLRRLMGEPGRLQISRRRLLLSRPPKVDSRVLYLLKAIFGGSFVPVSGDTFGNRRFGYQLTDVAEMAIVTVSVQTNLVISIQGTSVTPVPPITFLYDSQRPTVSLSTTSEMRIKETSIPIVIKFVKPVFDFNSSLITISGGHLLSFREMSKSIYAVHVQELSDSISVYIPENITTDVSGNKNRASNTLLIRHYSVPVESLILSNFVTTAFGVTCLMKGFLTVSTATLLSVGAFSRPSSILSSDPARNIFVISFSFYSLIDGRNISQH